MATDYRQIAEDNIKRYGTEIGRIGPTLFAHPYTERTHFVYELLQNAEDAIARRVKTCPDDDFTKSVSFRLFRDRLEFRHFGKPFDEADVRGICGILEGTGAGDPSRIGRFGIGFKSVYAYTCCPEIHSGDEHFQIRDYVRPLSLQEEADLFDGETLFILQFDHHPDIKPPVAFKEIGERLQNLGCHTLLFLSSINEVHWEIEGGAKGTYRRNPNRVADFPSIRLMSSREGKESYEDFIVFDQDIGTNGPSSGKIALAFRLENEAKTDTPHIVGIRESPLTVFFPTKLKTKLKFLIQGPYHTTPQRETIHEDDEWNRGLIGQTASLVAEVLVKIRDMGLLSTSFLESLSLRAFDFPERSLFRPIYDAVLSAMKEQALLPAADGSFISAQHAKLASSAALRDLLSDEQLTILHGVQSPMKWLAGEITQNKTPEIYRYLTTELGIEEVHPGKLAQRFNGKFVAQQSDEWVVKFYTFLSDQHWLWREKSHYDSPGPLRSKPFIRLSDNRHVVPFREDNVPNAYLPPEGDTEFPIVKREIAADDEARKFLEKLGLMTPDVVAEVLENILPRYERTEAVSAEQHDRDLEKILRAMREAEGRHKATLEPKLKQTGFLRAIRLGSDETRFMAPLHVYLQTPNLETYFQRCSEKVWFINESLSEEDQRLLKSLGAEERPRRKAFRPDFDDAKLAQLRRQGGCTREIELIDYTLEGLDDCLRRIEGMQPDEANRLAGTLWAFLGEMASASRPYASIPDLFKGTYRWFYHREWSETFDARFLELLREFAWLPGRDGQLHEPSDLSIDDLPEDFTKNEELGEILKMPPRSIDALAKAYGLDPQMLNVLQMDPGARNCLQRYIADKRAKEMVQVPPMPKPADGPSEPEASEITAAGKEGRSEKQTESDRDQLRLETRVYVEPAKPFEPDGGRAREQEKQSQLGNAGIQKVLQYERNNGRKPEYMGQTYPGYDIESTDSSGNTRYIEVKSLPDDWGQRGVALSASQFTKAQELGERFWLYVVERAEQADCKIHAIQNPAHLANQFIYDQGWKAIAQKAGP